MSGDGSAGTPGDRGETLKMASLTRGLVRGDEAAYRAFHAAYFERLLRYLLVVTRGDEAAAREALQGAMMRIVRHVRVFSDEAVFWSWLTVLARSALADETRRRRRYFAFLERFRPHAEAEAVGGAAVAADDSGARLGCALAESATLLDPEDRALIAAKYTQGQPVREIAVRLGVTEKTVESRLTRVRQKLKRMTLDRLKHETN